MTKKDDFAYCRLGKVNKVNRSKIGSTANEDGYEEFLK